MKLKILVMFAVITTVLSACGEGIHFVDTAAPAEPAAIVEEVQQEQTETLELEEETSAELPSEKEEPEVTETPETVSEQQEPAVESTPAPVVQQTAAPAPVPVSMAYGEIPFNLSAGTETWWQIDSSDSAYWAVRDNINAIRAAGGLGALSMSDGLSAAASSRCESFVAGGPFDHSGMTTASEICACGPIGSASSVCSMWQNSPDHYANIMRSDFTSMGVGCWFCSIGGNNYTYWVVTFG